MATVDTLLRTDFKAVDKRDEVQSAMGWLQGDTKRVPIVVDDGKPFGILNERALMARNLHPKAHLEGFTLVTRPVSLDATLEEAAARLAETRASYLPVTNGQGKLVGYVTALDVARERGTDRSARDLAVPVQPLTERHTLGDAVHLFAKEYVPYLPVMNGNGKVSGVLPRSTVLRVEKDSGSKGRKDAGGEKFHMINDPVSGFMDDHPVMLPAATSFHDLLDVVEEEGYALVQDRNGAFLGMVTPETLLRES